MHGVRFELQPLGLKTKCLAFELNSPEGVKFIQMVDCVTIFYHISSVDDLSFEKYICSTGHMDS